MEWGSRRCPADPVWSPQTAGVHNAKRMPSDSHPSRDVAWR
jgi:hypothetical protein